jgi:DNA-binding transcriptional LysR family regulator
MDIRQMKYFLEICKCGSISKAADSLFISQQGLSSAMHRLEKDLGCDLFYRKGNTLVLTEHGHYFLQGASEIVFSFDKLQNHFSFASSSANHISIICVYSIISKCPAALQQVLLGDNNAFHLTIGECYTDECVRYLENDECTFALSYDVPGRNYLEMERLFRVEHCLIVHKSHPLARYDEIGIEQLDNMRMILPIQKTAIRMKLDRAFRERKIAPTVVFATDQALQIYDLILNDPSLIARVTLSDAMAIGNSDIKILRLKDFDFFTNVSLVYKKDHQMSAVEQLFRRKVLNAVQAPGQEE